MRAPEVTYISIVNPETTPRETKYPISMTISPGDVERFYIVVGATKSVKLQLRVKFYIDDSDVVTSSPFDLDIWWPRDAKAYDDYRNGDFFVPKEGAWTLAGSSEEVEYEKVPATQQRSWWKRWFGRRVL